MGMIKVTIVALYVLQSIRNGEFLHALHHFFLLVLLIYGIDWFPLWGVNLYSVTLVIPALIVYVAWIAVRMVYRFWPDVYEFLPSTFGRWRRSREQWCPVTKISEPGAYAALCERCRRWTANSNLIMGSTVFLTRTEEFHEYFDSFDDLYRCVHRTKNSCHLCSQLWYSIDRELRQDVRKGESYYTTGVLKVRVWEDRPFSDWTFAQLIRGGRSIGARLLIHRKESNEISMPFKSLRAPSTDSWLHIELAKQWLERCSSLHHCHDSCYKDRLVHTNFPHAPQVGLSVVANDKPKRLVYVESEEPSSSTLETPLLKLQEFYGLDRRPEYLALSHCWGGNNNSLTLLNDNKLSVLENIPFSRLSKNIQDAVLITKRLGYSYIWIDSLCIIQDSREDWSEESTKMGSVYAGAVCTIASTGSNSGDGGCFHKRNCLSLQPCKIGVHSHDADSTGAIHIQQDDVFDFQRGVDKSPLNRRGWVFQERLLSSRILHFGAEVLYWECHQRSASELNPDGYIYNSSPEDFSDQNSLGRRATVDKRVSMKGASETGYDNRTPQLVREMSFRGPSLPALDPDDLERPHIAWQQKRNLWKGIRKASGRGWEEDADDIYGCRFRAEFNLLRRKAYGSQRIGMGSFSHCWYEIVEPYSRGKLTFSSDKLVALSGIVKEIQASTGYTYLAGLWKEHLVTDLVWFAVEGPGRRLINTSLTKPAEDHGKNSSVEADSTTSTKLAPTWSWASVEGVIGVDLLPENSLSKIHLQAILVTVLNAKVGPDLTHLRDTGDSRTPIQGFLELKGPLLKVCNVLSNVAETTMFLELSDNGQCIARCIPDVVRTRKQRLGAVLLAMPCDRDEIGLRKERRDPRASFDPQRTGGPGVPRLVRAGWILHNKPNAQMRAHKQNIN